MCRAAIVVCIGVSLTATSVAQVQGTAHTASAPPAGNVQNIDLWKIDRSKVSDAYLEQFVGFEGRAAETNHSNTNAVYDELLIRAEQRKDGRAAYLLGRQAQIPADPDLPNNPKGAAEMYYLGTSLNDPSAADAYSMCLRHGYGGVTQNISQADKLHAWALAHGYNEAQDRQGIAYNTAHPHERQTQPVPQLSTAPTATGLFVGAFAAMAALAVLSGSGDAKQSSGTSTSDQSSAYTDRNGLLKQCTVGELHWVSNSSESGGGHNEFQYVHHMGSECP
jgi:hypothetical protein